MRWFGNQWTELSKFESLIRFPNQALFLLLSLAEVVALGFFADILLIEIESYHPCPVNQQYWHKRESTGRQMLVVSVF